MSLPKDARARKLVPIYSGFVKYFPDAMAAVAQLSLIANEQHNPGEPLHWAKEKSADELDALMRHMIDDITSEPRDSDGVLHATKLAWRAMANLQRLADSGVNIFAEPPEESPQEPLRCVGCDADMLREDCRCMDECVQARQSTTTGEPGAHAWCVTCGRNWWYCSCTEPPPPSKPWRVYECPLETCEWETCTCRRNPEAKRRDPCFDA